MARSGETLMARHFGLKSVAETPASPSHPHHRETFVGQVQDEQMMPYAPASWRGSEVRRSGWSTTTKQDTSGETL
jgi:hypothetical protein